MALPPINRRPQERTGVLPRVTANTAQYIDVQNAGAGFNSLAKAFSVFAKKETEEEEKRQRMLDVESLDQHYLEVKENPEELRKAERSGDYSFFSIQGRLKRPLVLANLPKFTAQAMAPGLAVELIKGLENLAPTVDPAEYAKQFIAEKTEGMVNPSLLKGIHDSVNALTHKAIASHKQGLAILHNDKIGSTFRYSLGDQIVAKNLNQLVGFTKEAAASMTGQPFPKSLSVVKSILKNEIVTLSVTGTPEQKARAAALMTENNEFFTNGTIADSFTLEELTELRSKAEASMKERTSAASIAAANELNYDLLNNVPPATAWAKFQKVANAENIGPSSTLYVKAFRAFRVALGSGSKADAVIAAIGKNINPPPIDSATANQVLGKVLRTPAQRWGTKDIVTVAYALRQLGDDAAGKWKNQLTTILLGGGADSKALYHSLRIAAKDSDQGNKIDLLDMLGKDSQGLLFMSFMYQGDTSTQDQYNERKKEWDALKSDIDTSANLATAFFDYTKNMELNNGNTLNNTNRLTLFMRANKQDLANILGVSEDTIVNAGGNLRRHILERLNYAAATLGARSNSANAEDSAALLERFKEFAGRQQWIVIPTAQGTDQIPVSAVVATSNTGETRRFPQISLDSNRFKKVFGISAGTSTPDSMGNLTLQSGDQDSTFEATTPVEMPLEARRIFNSASARGDVTVVETDDDTIRVTVPPTDKTEIPLDDYGAAALVYNSEDDAWTMRINPGKWNELHQTSLLKDVVSSLGNLFGSGEAAAEALNKGPEEVLRVLKEKNSPLLMEAREYNNHMGSVIGNIGLIQEDKLEFFKRFMNRELTEEDISKLPEGYAGEYRRRVQMGNVPLGIREIATQVSKELGVTSANDYPVGTATTPGIPEIVAQAAAYVTQAVTRGEAHPDTIAAVESRVKEFMSRENSLSNIVDKLRHSDTTAATFTGPSDAEAATQQFNADREEEIKPAIKRPSAGLPVATPGFSLEQVIIKKKLRDTLENLGITKAVAAYIAELDSTKPTEPETSTGPSDAEAATQQFNADREEEIKTAIEMDLHDTVAKVNAENNFVPNAEEVTARTAQEITQSIPNTSWRPEGTAVHLGDSNLSRASNPVGISEDDGSPKVFRNPELGIKAGVETYRQKYNSGDRTVNRLLTGRGQMAADTAASMLGKSEHGDNESLKRYFNRTKLTRGMNPEQTPWCAAFVNVALNTVGLKGSGSNIATSFMNWGEPGTLEDLAPGDVLVVHRGKKPGEKGAHAGIATGKTQVIDGVTMIEMIGGNEGDKVKSSFRRLKDVIIRKPTAEQRIPMGDEIVGPQSFAVPNGSVKKVSRKLGVSPNDPVDLNDKEQLTSFLQALTEVTLGDEEGSVWGPYIDDVVQGREVQMPSTGTGGLVFGHGFRADWPDTDDALSFAGVTDIKDVSDPQANQLTNARVNYIMGKMPEWFDGAKMTESQRVALMKYVYQSPWNKQTERPAFITPELQAAVDADHKQRVARIIRRETRIFNVGLSIHQRSLKKHAIKINRSLLATQYLGVP